MYFPHPLSSNDEGLLAIGGDLSYERLCLAYTFGIFPWYNQPPILWWFTFPRAVIYPHQIRVSKSMRRLLNSKQIWRITINQAFTKVIEQCARIKRSNQQGTWISMEIKEAFLVLHKHHKAHSVEIWEGTNLVGGLYGVVCGRIFYGESMFSTKSNSSKYGFILFAQYLNSLGCTLIDCQQDTPHMRSLGAILLSRDQFWKEIKENLKFENLPIGQHSFEQWHSNQDN